MKNLSVRPSWDPVLPADFLQNGGANSKLLRDLVDWKVKMFREVLECYVPLARHYVAENFLFVSVAK